MKRKNIFMVVLCVILIFSLAGCGVTNDDFVSTVRNYRIFDETNMFEMKTVADFERKIESYDGEGWRVTTTVSPMWSYEKLKEDDKLIQALEENTDFVFDKKKYYGKLDVIVVMFSQLDYSTKEDYIYSYLFSLDKDGNVIPEGWAQELAKSFGSYEYNKVELGGVDIGMDTAVLVTATAQEIYNE